MRIYCSKAEAKKTLLWIWAVERMRKGCKRTGGLAAYSVAFGLGLVLSCFLPIGLTMFIMAVLLVALGIALLRC